MRVLLEVDRSLWESVATVQWIVENEASFRTSTFGLRGHPFDGIVFLSH